MEIPNRFELQERLSSIRPNMQSSSLEENFYGTFQPASYSHFIDNRSFDNYTNSRGTEEAKKPRESLDLRSRNSIPKERDLYQSAQNFHDPSSDLLSSQQEKIQKLESILIHKEAAIDELKHQKFQLSREIDELIDRIKNQDLQRENEKKAYLNKIEEHKYREAENEQLIKNIQQELESSVQQRESYKLKYKSLPVAEDFDHLLSESKSLKSQVEILSQEKKQLELEVTSKKDTKHEFIIFKLQEQIKQLQEENENLTMSLNTRPTFKELKDRDYVISELKEKIRTRPSRSRSTSQTRDQNRQSIVKDRELHNLPLGELPSVPTMNVLLTELLNMLKVNSFHEIVPKVREIKKRSKSSDLEIRIAKMVKDLSPHGTFHPSPTPQQSWKWVRKVVEEYLALKRDLEKEEKNRVIVNRLLGALGVIESSQIIKEVNILIGESHANKALREKIDLILESDPDALLKDFKYLVNEIL